MRMRWCARGGSNFGGLAFFGAGSTHSCFVAFCSRGVCPHSESLLTDARGDKKAELRTLAPLLLGRQPVRGGGGIGGTRQRDYQLLP
jgi:hypothetical protein